MCFFLFHLFMECARNSFPMKDSSGCGELATKTAATPTATLKLKMPNLLREEFSQEKRHDNDSSSSQQKEHSTNDGGDAIQSGFLNLKIWLSGMKSKDLATLGGELPCGSNKSTERGAEDDVVHLQQQQMTPLETKSLCGSPQHRYGRSPTSNVELIATQKQQIMARFGQHIPGFGFTQSKSSCLFEDEDDDDDDGLMLAESGHVPPSNYSYRNGNQFEYMGGPYGYIDPIYSHQLANNNSNRHPGVSHRETSSKSFQCNGRINNSVRLEELDIVQHAAGQRPSLFEQHQSISIRRQGESSAAHHQPQPVLLLLPTLVRSAESLVVLSK
jgi:hypothetical protein